MSSTVRYGHGSYRFSAKPVALGLSEWYSPVVPGSGLHPRPAPASAQRTYFPEVDDSWSSIWYASRKGEDVDGCHDRCRGFLSALIPEIERRFGDKHKRILLVSHAATIIALSRELVGNRTLPLRVGCCTISEFSARPGGDGAVGTWQAKRLADGSFLKNGAERDWGFEDIEIANGMVSVILTPYMQHLARRSWFRRSYHTLDSREQRTNQMSLSGSSYQGPLQECSPCCLFMKALDFTTIDTSDDVPAYVALALV